MQETHERTGRGTYGTLRRVAPKVIVLIVLGAVGLWGHQSGWRAPRFSSLFGSGGRDAEEDWCLEHRVPESRCVACNPSLVGADPEDWCREHGVPESKCPFCHPEILRGGVPADWCAEHGVPESQCTLCNPSIAVKGISAPERPGLEVLPGDRVPTPNPACTLHEARVQFASPEAMRKAGIELATVEERRMPEVVTAAGEIEYDGRRIARVTARAAGTAVGDSWGGPPGGGNSGHFDIALTLNETPVPAVSARGLALLVALIAAVGARRVSRLLS